MCKLRSTQILVIALALAILLALGAVVYRVYFWQRLRLDSPAGGTAWESGQEVPIKWFSTGGLQTIRIEYSIDGGTYQFIDRVPAARGAYTWQPPAIQSPGVRVRVSSVDNANVKAVSEPFGIGVSVTVQGTEIDVTAPEAGAQWPAGSQRTISWTAPNLAEDLALSYTFGNEYIAIDTVPAQPGMYEWIVPNTLTNDAQVRISSTISPGISTTSSFFSIVPAQPSLSLTSPQGGDVWQVGSTQTIRWTSANAGGDVRLSWSLDGGTATVISDTVPIEAQEYTWIVEPICEPFSEKARITVESLAHSNLSDTNPQPFTITSPALRADATACLQDDRCYLTNDPAIHAGAYQDGTISAPWLLTGSEAVDGPDQDRALREFRRALYEPLVCDQLGNGPFELIAVLCTGNQCTTNRCQFVYDQGGRVEVACFPEEPGLPAGWGVVLPFPYVLIGGLALGGLLIAAGIYLQRKARAVAS